MDRQIADRFAEIRGTRLAGLNTHCTLARHDLTRDDLTRDVPGTPNANYARALAALRLRRALLGGDATEALRWLQCCRRTPRRPPSARASEDTAIARGLSELRHIIGELDTAGVDPQRTHRLLRRRRAVEAEIARLARPVAEPSPPPPTAAELAESLGDRVLVEFVAVDGTLNALVMVDGSVHHRVLCAVAVARGELAALRFAARRVVMRQGSERSQVAARGGIAYARAQLNRLLLEPIADLIEDRPVVLAPTGDLHELAWPMLELCHGRPLSVVPSSSLWWHANRRPDTTGGTVLVSGPAPAQAAAEVAAIGDRIDGALVLSGGLATVPAVLSALDGVATGHIASHGVFWADSPLFSHLRLADGPMTVYHLSGLRRAPNMLVLSACDGGLSAVHPGDELQGLSAALLGLGTRVVVASLGPVDDEGTKRLMVDFYDRLRAGATPSRALAAAQAALPHDHAVTGRSFVCMGAG